MAINTIDLPENIQIAIAKLEQEKATYTQLQERLSHLHQKLEKHRKSVAATQLQAEQFGTQWRDAFRENDGELTKDIRAIKNSEIEAQDFALEYTKLVNALLPEFELCQLDTHDARTSYLSIAKQVKESYTDHIFDAAIGELLSLPQANLFLVAIKTKFENIEKIVCEDIRVPVEQEKVETEQRQAALLRNTLLAFINAITDADIQAAGLSKFSRLNSAPEELNEISIVAKQKKRTELKAMLN